MEPRAASCNHAVRGVRFVDAAYALLMLSIGGRFVARGGAVLTALLLLTFAGCAGAYVHPEASGEHPGNDTSSVAGRDGPVTLRWSPGEATSSVLPIPLDRRNILQPGEDGTLPVKVRWVHQLSAPEGFYVVDDVVYVSDECLITLSVDSGDELWRACKPDGNGIFSDGGDEIGPAGPGRIRVYAWYNETLLIDTASHQVIESRSVGGEYPPGFRPFPVSRDQTYKFGFSGRRLEARDAAGRVAWRLRTRNPMIDGGEPVRSPRGVILVTGSGLMVAVDYVH
jgi:hypothetical protein